jgi:RNA polymerase sigma-70 factor (ECF subfamily)
VDDKLIVAKVLNGSTESFSLLVDKYYNRIVGFICRTGFPREDAEDITQEVFIRAYKNLFRYDISWSFSTWIFTIAINLSRNYRKRKRIRTVELNKLHIADEVSPSVNRHLDDLINRQMVSNMLSTLKEQVRYMLILRFYNNMSYDEIGDICGLSGDAVKMRISRALKKLRRKFGSSLSGGVYREMLD